MQILILALLAIVCVQSQEAYCDFSNGIGLQGKVWIDTTENGISLDFSEVTDQEPVLSAHLNSIHIHMWGFTADETCAPAYTSKHYNPVENYGELSCLNGYFDGSDVGTLMWEQPAWLTGENGILGRSLVVHDNTSARVACCNIVLAGTDSVVQGAAPDYDVDALCGDFVLSQNATHFTVWANVTVQYEFFTAEVCTAREFGNNTANLDAGDTHYYDVADVSIMGANQVAGLSILYEKNTFKYCCSVVVKSNGPNCGDSENECDGCVVHPTETTEEEMTSTAAVEESSESVEAPEDTTESPIDDTDFSLAFLASVTLLFVSLF